MSSALWFSTTLLSRPFAAPAWIQAAVDLRHDNDASKQTSGGYVSLHLRHAKLEVVSIRCCLFEIVRLAHDVFLARVVATLSGPRCWCGAESERQNLAHRSAFSVTSAYAGFPLVAVNVVVLV